MATGTVAAARLDPELEAAIEEYRRGFRRIPTRSEAIKLLLRQSLGLNEPSAPVEAEPSVFPQT